MSDYHFLSLVYLNPKMLNAPLLSEYTTSPTWCGAYRQVLSPLTIQAFPNIYMGIANTFPQRSFIFFCLVCHCCRRRGTWFFLTRTFMQISSFEIFLECATYESLAGITIISNYSIDIRQCIVFSVRTLGRNVNTFSISRTFFEL